MGLKLVWSQSEISPPDEESTCMECGDDAFGNEFCSSSCDDAHEERLRDEVENENE